jgi:hypothetical protein
MNISMMVIRILIAGICILTLNIFRLLTTSHLQFIGFRLLTDGIFPLMADISALIVRICTLLALICRLRLDIRILISGIYGLIFNICMLMASIFAPMVNISVLIVTIFTLMAGIYTNAGRFIMKNETKKTQGGGGGSA